MSAASGVYIELAGEPMRLVGAALHWPGERALIIADPHFGKPATFRAAGVPVPEASTDADLARLTHLLDVTEARRLIVLGDFFHAASGRSTDTMRRLTAWRDAHAALDVTVVRGNHDVSAGDPPDDWRVRVVGEGEVDGPFVLRHHPGDDARGHVLAGHVHPAVRLRDLFGVTRLSCFHVTPACTTLPAFTRFAGHHALAPGEDDRVFAVSEDADGAPVEVTRAALRVR